MLFKLPYQNTVGPRLSEVTITVAHCLGQRKSRTTKPNFLSESSLDNLVLSAGCVAICFYVPCALCIIHYTIFSSLMFLLPLLGLVCVLPQVERPSFHTVTVTQEIIVLCTVIIRGVTLITHPHLESRSRMSRSYTSSPPQAPSCRVVGQL
jgi:hypothetical protein